MQHSVQSLSRLSGVSPARLRTWERRYGVPSPARTASGLRRYSPEDVSMVQRMAALVSAGLPASEAAAAVRAERVPTIAASLPGPAEGLRNPSVAAIASSVTAFDRVAIATLLREAVEDIGWPATLRELVFPALRETGDAWHDGRLTPAHEHFLSDVMRTELVLATASLPDAAPGPPVILACPEDEPHDIGLLALRYMLLRDGVPVLYLGADLPASALVRAARDSRAAAVVLSAVSPAGMASLVQSVRAVDEHLPGLPMFVGGPAVEPQEASRSVVLPADIEMAATAVASVVGPSRKATS